MSTVISVAVSFVLLIGILRNRRRSAHDAELPSVAVIVAGRNERATIAGCLKSLLELDYPPSRVERYYIDDGSTDGTAEIAAEIAQISGGRLRILHAPPNRAGLGPKKNALSAAIQETQADLLVFTDADAEVPRGWLKAVASEFQPNVGAVAGLFAPIARKRIAGRLYLHERLMHGAISAGCVGWGYPSSVCGANFAYRRECYEELRGFAGAEMQAGDDDMMAQAIRRLGWQVRFVTGPDTTVRDMRRPKLQEFLKSKRRHQSTARHYPLGWLLFFWIAIIAQLGYLGGWGHAATHPPFLPIALTGFLLRSICDYLLLGQLARICFIQNWRRGFLVAEVLLPFYLLLQPIFALGRAFEWKERRLPAEAHRKALAGQV